MFIPLKDLNPRQRLPIINTLLIVANAAVFLYQLSLTPRSEKSLIYMLGMIPARVPQLFSGHGGSFGEAFLPLLTSMFLHAGWLHLLGNMLFLWIFGDNVEDFLGHFEYLLFYLVCGVGASLTHMVTNLYSTVPALGASGAISGVMGAYMVLYPRSRVLTLVFIFVVQVPAVVILGYWFVLQFLGGMQSLGMRSSGGVAFWAHIGGFLLGILLVSGSKKR
ncbi:MAG TPA: rhomboid family intramembrane serine protease [Candidatus Acidoferrales bacterium]|nr:rhomboid family intramembrane serine protease [Candidatus Acidoferrales bacterium]